MYKIIEKYQDMSKKWVVRVLISNDESAFFNFDLEPSEDMIQEVAQKFVDNKKMCEIVA